MIRIDQRRLIYQNRTQKYSSCCRLRCSDLNTFLHTIDCLILVSSDYAWERCEGLSCKKCTVHSPDPLHLTSPPILSCESFPRSNACDYVFRALFSKHVIRTKDAEYAICDEHHDGIIFGGGFDLALPLYADEFGFSKFWSYAPENIALPDERKFTSTNCVSRDQFILYMFLVNDTEMFLLLFRDLTRRLYTNFSYVDS